MPFRFNKHVRLTITIVAALAFALSLWTANVVKQAPAAKAASPSQPFCNVRPQLCTETVHPWNYAGQYTGHDEPSVLFYSTVPGSGNSNLYRMTLPTDPPTPPAQAGTGGTWNFQLHPAFWFGMAMCDDQSAPNPGAACTPDSDTNIFNSTNPTSPTYMGKHPGTAFMEMQFYPPGWGPVSCTDANGNQDGKWCAALNIDSFSEDSNTGVPNNNTCLNITGEEYVNYAILTHSGTPVAPANPFTPFGAQAVVTSNTLEMSSGDALSVDMHDTDAGFQVVVRDLTTGQSGFMTASSANGFGHPLYQPDAKKCTNQPYTFHPMYGTSTPDTRVLWAAHTYNIAFSDELGHFEYCNSVNVQGGKCKTSSYPNPTDPTGDSDDQSCFTAPVVSTPSTSLTGCVFSDGDFDGPEYQTGTWPGSPGAVASKVSTPIRFTSPLFTRSGTSELLNYKQAAFETNLPRIEGADVSSNNNCQRHVFPLPDPSPGAGCVNPPTGATFYPIYTTAKADGHCIWQEGGASIPDTTNTFGGTSAAEYSGLLVNVYPAPGNTTQGIYETFHRTLSDNPCPARGGVSGG